MSIENLTWHDTFVTRKLRENLLSQKSKLLWFTGLSGSGKSTVANALDLRLNEMGKATYLLDGDNIRLGINSDLGFSKQDRNENIRRISEIGKLFVDSGLITIACFISPLKANREMARSTLGDDFIEIFVDCPLSECERRDPKNLYKKARLGEIKEFTGISSPYENPENPEIVVNTKEKTVDQCVDQILDYLKLVSKIE
ncbi:adenylyl-sulfate kinase [Clostridium estertheticum]|uniref:Adenylyl-sulfate kinase n=2 Tax=Clostridium estertheticum TaxID=238834 RepID=A0A1J0GGB7_9CLOT|nr:adenylyl-sulfate kinase [Clostridium estertheticum]APC40418.1 adenylyl-sulfate kinase [Clostridium estertheticum subsp. estertheticum]MBU3075143.1 adenylyl-sulfate kinase [Clostridium estertheticum]MBU3165358.1 adenylyl-sulfate kinase [Clostridium estertheticum]MBU3173115.1 adenylyl-sulfate kinase [Clostridium estertheticum]MBZ9617764.1 adenylyl-sulfate kinase [Clostridium estertheticum subsp. laramiense]